MSAPAKDATVKTKKLAADGSTSSSDPFALMAAATQQDKRFLGQLASTKAAFDKRDWKGTMLGCRMLFRIADDGGYLEKVEPVLRPLFDSVVAQFEESRKVARALLARLRTSAHKLKQLSRLASVLRVAV